MTFAHGYGYGSVFWGPPVFGFWFLFSLAAAALLIALRRRGYGWCRGYDRRFRGPSRRRGEGRRPAPSSGNRAFDDHRAEAMRHLDEEQAEFMRYVEERRRARDKREFDEFAEKRRDA